MDNSTLVGFSALGLCDNLVKAVTALGYEEPTPIQREAIPLLLAGRDVLGQAATGTGKTAAFALPMLDRIVAGGPAARAGDPRGLVLVPTRELAMQVAGAIQKYATSVRLTVVAIYGGAAMDQQIRSLRRGTDIVVATPGRALDHLRRSTLKLDGLRVLVLDEADEMLDMGFAEDLETILGATPADRQTALFSATMPSRIAAIAQRHLKNPSRVTLARERSVAGGIPQTRQLACIVPRAQKPAALARILGCERPKSAIVFCRTRREVETLAETLTSSGHRCLALHGGMEQRQRDHVMQMFRGGKADLLIATDVAARGLDIEHLSHVINFDVPAGPEAYLHRIGRTGRIGREGVAITLVDPRDQRLLRNIEAFTRQKIVVTTVPSVSDLRARQLDGTRALLRERVMAFTTAQIATTPGSGGSVSRLDEMRAVVDALALEFDVRDIAAAAVAMMHEASSGPAAGAPRTDSSQPIRASVEAPRPRRFEPASAERRPASGERRPASNERPAAPQPRRWSLDPRAARPRH